MTAIFIEPQENLITVGELIEYFKQFPSDNWIEYQQKGKSKKFEETISLDRDIDSNIVTIIFS